jgi:hypothetical protein
MFVVTGLEAKKPDKPVQTPSEWIYFEGDLAGGEEVEGCCPNAGPFPEYTMTLDFPGDHPLDGTHDGYLFINNFGVGRDHGYIVQFWNDDIGIEIIGGVVDNDKKNKILTVTFTNQMCTDLYTGNNIAAVSFVLVRTP